MWNNKNNLCYSYVLGKRDGKYCGRAQDGHVSASELSEAFVEKLCQLLRPGVEARKVNKPAVQAMDYYPSNKCQRTS
jgi:hypothetical protein